MDPRLPPGTRAARCTPAANATLGTPIAPAWMRLDNGAMIYPADGHPELVTEAEVQAWLDAPPPWVTWEDALRLALGSWCLLSGVYTAYLLGRWLMYWAMGV